MEECCNVFSIIIENCKKGGKLDGIIMILVSNATAIVTNDMHINFRNVSLRQEDVKCMFMKFQLLGWIKIE